MFAHFLSLLSFALMVAAAPMNTEVVQENAWKYGTGGGVIGFIVLILDIIVFCTSPRFPPTTLSAAPACSLPRRLTQRRRGTKLDNTEETKKIEYQC